MQSPTLAHRMGDSSHLSPLLMKVARLGVREPHDLEIIAMERGLRYFGPSGNMAASSDEAGSIAAKDPSVLPNEELAIALINPAAPYSLMRIRMAAAIMAADGVSAEKLLRLSNQERCNAILRHIAECGAKVEPRNPFWQQLLQGLPEVTSAHPDVLPHITRFVAMTGITRNGPQNIMRWIRPTS